MRRMRRQPPDERENELAVEPKPLRVVVAALREVLVPADDAPPNGSEAERVVEVPDREKIGQAQALLPVLLLVRVQEDR
jgi:hypothetical protein